MGRLRGLSRAKRRERPRTGPLAAQPPPPKPPARRALILALRRHREQTTRRSREFPRDSGSSGSIVDHVMTSTGHGEYGNTVLPAAGS